MPTRQFRNIPEDTFMFGASTAPYAKATDWPMDEWENDLKNMRELNFNTIRVFAAWDRIERVEGKYDFEKQDFLLELASKHDMNVIINMGGLFGNPCGCYQPQWLAQNDSLNIWESSPGVEASMPNRICPDDPVHLEKANAYMSEIIRHYGNHERVVAWMIWNEPDRRKFCYCPHTVGLFQKWLKDKYKNLGALNELWSSESPTVFKNWEEIPASGTTACVAKRDWLLFNQYRLYTTMKEHTKLVNELDPLKRPTTSNIVYHHTAHEDGMHGANLGLDLGEVGKSLNIMGGSCYTIAHPFDPRPAYEQAYKLSRFRSVSTDDYRRFLILETEAGPFKRMITDGQRRHRFYQLLAHNAKSIILWNYRSRVSDGQVADFHMQKWDGSISRRAEKIGEFSRILQKHAKTLNRVYPQREAAVLTTSEQEVLSYVTHGSEYVDRHESRFGAYKILWDMNIPTDCLTETSLDEMARYKLILLPCVENINSELSDKLTRFVEQGGILIAESPFAFKDRDGHLQYQAPGMGLKSLFGGYTCDREGWETAEPIVCPAGMSKAHFLWHEFTLCGGEVLATYGAGGSPAVIANDYGKGRAVLAGTEVFRQYVKDPQRAMTALLRKEIESSGAQATARIEGDVENVEVARLAGEGGIVYILLNHNPYPVTTLFELMDDGVWCDLESGAEVDLTKPVALSGETALALLKK